MPEQLSGGHYSPVEEAEIFENWANTVAQQDPELAEHFARLLCQAVEEPFESVQMGVCSLETVSADSYPVGLLTACDLCQRRGETTALYKDEDEIVNFTEGTCWQFKDAPSQCTSQQAPANL